MTMKARLFLLITLGGGFLVAYSTEVDPRKSDFVRVPDVVLMDTENASDVLQETSLRCEKTKKHSNSVPLDHVISQDPEPETLVMKNTVVKLFVSDGPGEVEETPEEEPEEEATIGGCGCRKSKTSTLWNFFLLS